MILLKISQAHRVLDEMKVTVQGKRSKTNTRRPQITKKKPDQHVPKTTTPYVSELQILQIYVLPPSQNK
jgi:hypothetical protein